MMSNYVLYYEADRIRLVSSHWSISQTNDNNNEQKNYLQELLDPSSSTMHLA